jgi:hypothetical protein
MQMLEENNISNDFKDFFLFEFFDEILENSHTIFESECDNSVVYFRHTTYPTDGTFLIFGPYQNLYEALIGAF